VLVIMVRQIPGGSQPFFLLIFKYLAFFSGFCFLFDSGYVSMVIYSVVFYFFCLWCFGT